MSDDLAFQIQLGLILPKMKDKLSADLMTITEELVDVIKAGATSGEEVSLDAVKELVMKDFEIFIDTSIFPVIDKKLNPPSEEPAAEEGGGEEASEEAPAEEGGE